MNDVAIAIFDSVVQTSLAGLLLVQDGKIVYANRAFSRMLDRDPDSWGEQADSWFFLHAADADRLRQALAEGVAAADDAVMLTAAASRADGTVLHLQIRAQRCEFRDRPAIVVSVMDVSEHQRFLERLEASERKHRSIVEQSEDGIVLMDERGTIVEWNRAEERITGRPRSEVLGQAVWDVMPAHIPAERRTAEAREAAREVIQRFLASGDAPWLHELTEQEIVRSDGSRRIVQERYFGIPTAQGHMCGSICRDITARRQMEEDLRAHQRRLRSLASQLARAEEHERRRIATDLHDQIGQNLVAANLQLGAVRHDLADEEKRAALENVQQLIGQAIEGTRTLTFELAPPVLYEIGLTAALEWLAERLEQQHGLRVVVECSGDGERLDEEAKVCLFRCVRELLTNVVRHAGTQEATVSCYRDSLQAQVVVADTGRGMSADQAASSAKDEHGFGLFNVRERIEQLDGKFRLESAPDQGVRVTLTLPVRGDKVER